MSISTKLGSNYEAIRSAARLKTIHVLLNDITFDLQVRVPVKREMEVLTAAITDPDVQRVNAIYETLSAPLIKTLDEAELGFIDALNADSDKIKVTDNDLIVDGNSVRLLAKMTVIWQMQVEKYFSLLVSATGEPITESFEEIAEEFPEAIIKEIVSKIDEAIRPSYKEAKKN